MIFSISLKRKYLVNKVDKLSGYNLQSSNNILLKYHCCFALQ